MYRDDQEALRARADAATREADLLRRENDAIRRAVAITPASVGTALALPPARVYSGLDLRHLPVAERARLAQHNLKPFSVAATGVLNVITLGLFSLIHFGLMHDRLPRAAANDPSAGKAIGFSFIPYFNLYWFFFNGLRLCDRLALQYRVRGLRPKSPRGIVLAATVVTVIPYVNILVGLPILWTIAACFLQSTVNEVAAMPQDSWDASELPAPVSMPTYGLPAGPAYPVPASVPHA